MINEEVTEVNLQFELLVLLRALVEHLRGPKRVLPKVCRQRKALMNKVAKNFICLYSIIFEREGHLVD